MTGTGTQTDPYVVSDWEEFVTAVGKTDVYVECSKNAVWDMNNIAPDGIKSPITMYAANINGNGTTILNLTSDINNTAGGVFTHARTTMKNINFENLYLSDGTALFYQSSYASTLYKCIFTGYIANNSALFRGDGRTYTIDRCLLSLDFFADKYGDPTITDKARANMSDCLLILGGKTNVEWLIGSIVNGISPQYPSSMTNCRVEGTLPAPLIRSNTNSRYNIINANIPSNVKQLGYSDSSVKGLWLVNKDLVEDLDAFVAGTDDGRLNVTYLTSSELKDPVVLRRVGYPAPLTTT